MRDHVAQELLEELRQAIGIAVDRGQRIIGDLAAGFLERFIDAPQRGPQQHVGTGAMNRTRAPEPGTAALAASRARSCEWARVASRELLNSWRSRRRNSAGSPSEARRTTPYKRKLPPGSVSRPAASNP